MGTNLIALLAMVGSATAAVGTDTIRITVMDETDTPAAARVLIRRSDRWAPFANTGKDGSLTRRFSCADGVMFKATPSSPGYYDSDEQFCAPEVRLRIAAKPIPYLADMMQSKTVTVGGAPMYPTKNIVENAVNSKDHTTLVSAIKAAGLVDTLSGPGPFTVFAPTNAAFAKLPAGTVDSLVKPENRDTLTKILSYHVVSGVFDTRAIAAAVKAGGGSATLTTIEGETLKFVLVHGRVVLTDAKGGTATVILRDVYQSNGVIQVVDRVLMP